MTALCLCVAHKKKAVVHNLGPGARASAQRHQRARACPRPFVVASLPGHSTCVIVVSILHVFRHFHRLHSEWGGVQMTNATAINAVPGCLRWHHPGVEPAAQCASTRENSPGSDTQ